MRELTEAERAAMNEAIRPFWISRDGLLPKETRAFETGFIAGLEHQQAANAELVLALRRLVEFCERVWPPDEVRQEYEVVKARAALTRVSAEEAGE